MEATKRRQRDTKITGSFSEKNPRETTKTPQENDHTTLSLQLSQKIEDELKDGQKNMRNGKVRIHIRHSHSHTLCILHPHTPQSRFHTLHPTRCIQGTTIHTPHSTLLYCPLSMTPTAELSFMICCPKMKLDEKVKVLGSIYWINHKSGFCEFTLLIKLETIG